MYYTFHNVAAAKGRGLLGGQLMVDCVPFQCIGEFLPKLGSKAKSTKEGRFMPTIFVRLAQQIVNDFGSLDKQILSVRQIHWRCGRAGLIWIIAPALAPG
jgi:hypothetical protein